MSRQLSAIAVTAGLAAPNRALAAETIETLDAGIGWFGYLMAALLVFAFSAGIFILTQNMGAHGFSDRGHGAKPRGRQRRNRQG